MLQLLQFENLLFCRAAIGGPPNDRLVVYGTVATVAVARSVSKPVEAPFGVRLRFALVGEPTAKVERTYSGTFSAFFLIVQ